MSEIFFFFGERGRTQGFRRILDLNLMTFVISIDIINTAWVRMAVIIARDDSDGSVVREETILFDNFSVWTVFLAAAYITSYTLQAVIQQ